MHPRSYRILGATLLCAAVAACSSGPQPLAEKDNPSMRFANAPFPPPASEATRAYALMVARTIQQHITPTAPVSGDATTEVEVRTNPDGSIVAIRIVHGSGVRHWDEAVMQAVSRAGRLPADEEGKVPTVVLIQFHSRGSPQKQA